MSVEDKVNYVWSSSFILGEPPSGSELAKHKITLNTLVTNHYLRIGEEIKSHVKHDVRTGHIVKSKDGRYGFHFPPVIALNPHQLLVKLYGKEKTEGRSWHSLTVKDGRTLKEVKEEYIEEMIKQELIDIPGVFLAYLTLLDKPNNKSVPGFVVYVDRDHTSDLSKLLETYKILTAENIEVKLGSRPKIRD